MAMRIAVVLLCGLTALAAPGVAEVRIIRKEIRQIFGGSQSPDDARE